MKKKIMIILTIITIAIAILSVMFLYAIKKVQTPEEPKDLKHIEKDFVSKPFNNMKPTEDQLENYEILKNRTETNIDKETKKLQITKIDNTIEEINIAENEYTNQDLNNNIDKILNIYYHDSYYSFTKEKTNPAYKDLLKSYNINVDNYEYYNFTYSPEENKFYTLIIDDNIELETGDNLIKFYSDALSINVPNKNSIYVDFGYPNIVINSYTVDSKEAEYVGQEIIDMLFNTYPSSFGIEGGTKTN